MPKMRTHKAAAKRFKVTGTGKVVFRHAFRSHQLTRKSAARKRRLQVPGVVAPGDAKQVRRQLGQ
jgi:large subunit ribosomal protein L35